MLKTRIWRGILSLLLMAPAAWGQEAKPEITSQLGTKYYANKDEKSDVAAAEQNAGRKLSVLCIGLIVPEFSRIQKS